LALGKEYLCVMTRLLQKALEAVRLLPPENQDEIARAMLALAGNESALEDIDPAHLADVLESLAQALPKPCPSLAQAKRGEFATEAEVEAAFRRFDK
jgi:hypothetical protein